MHKQEHSLKIVELSTKRKNNMIDSLLSNGPDLPHQPQKRRWRR